MDTARGTPSARGFSEDLPKMTKNNNLKPIGKQKTLQDGETNQDSVSLKADKGGRPIKQEVSSLFEEYIREFIRETRDFKTAMIVSRRASMCINDVQV